LPACANWPKGALIDVALVVKAAETHASDAVLVFDDATGRVLDLDCAAARQRSSRGWPGQAAPRRSRQRARAAKARRRAARGDAVAASLGMAGAAARRCLGRAAPAGRRSTAGRSGANRAQGRAAACLYLPVRLAGDLPGYEEAIRALFADDGDAFAARMAAWPQDIRDYALLLASGNAEA
jgi:hypothetical protein